MNGSANGLDLWKQGADCGSKTGQKALLARLLRFE
jgi:hypothetical protein